MLPDSASLAASFNSPRALIESAEGTTLPELCEWHAKKNPDYPIFRFVDGDDIKQINYYEAFQAVRRAARYVRSLVVSTERVPVAILANTDPITYNSTSIGIMRAGYIAFHISPRNGPSAVADLLRRTQCKYVLVSQDTHMSNLAKEAIQSLEGVTLHPLQTFQDLFSEITTAGAAEADSDFPVPIDKSASTLILHSSGSMNHPKPVYWSYKRAISFGTVPWHGEVDITGYTIASHGTPMFHTMGFCMCVTAACNGCPLAVFKPSTPPIFPTAENIFEGAVATGSDLVLTVPSFIEQWSREPEKVAIMARMKGLMFGGAPLNQEIGDYLASQGASLITFYGCTEVGTISDFVPANPGIDWAYFRFSIWTECVPVDVGDGKYEVVVLSPPDCPLNLINTKLDGRDAYATNDLVESHPTKVGMWRVYGRQDEQIILSNGEKTNPLPIEHFINEDEHVATCIVFGHGKFQNGVLILPKPEYQFALEDTKALEAFRNTVWPAVQRANEFAPQHSRIFKEMILVASPSKPFEYNAKGYPRRIPNLKRYHDEIEAVYAEVERSAQSEVAAPIIWDLESTRGFIRNVIAEVLQRSIADDADLFRNSCDSLQATWIRNTILRALREHSPSAAKQLPMNVVFQAPSISALTEAVLHTVHGTSPAKSTAISEEDLVQVAERYSSDLPSRSPKLIPSNGTKDVVLITGTTGGFGCDILEHLLRDDEIAMVYAFNRQGSNAIERQRARFRERGLDEKLLDATKFKMVEAALDVPSFGIEPALLDEIRGSVTHIMHNAWRVDFNLSLPSFEVDLKGVRNFVELSLSSPFVSPPRIVFVSSVGIFGKCLIEPPVPEFPIPPSSALDTGYSESKWVSEKILSNAAERAGVPSVIVRLGQVCGDRLGHWNEKEWFPALVKSAVFTRCLPDLEGAVTFIPSYPAARAFVEMRSSPAPFLHLVHPRPVAWRTLITPLAQELDVPLVPYPEYLAALERSAGEGENSEVEAMRENPALRLLDHFRAQTFVPGKEPMGVVYLSTQKAESVSPELARLPQLDADTSRQWVAAWRKSGFLPTQ